MHKSLGLGAALAFGANAFLLPSTVTLESVNTDPKFGALSVIDPFNQLVVAPCHGCQSENIALNISVGAEPSTLTLNGARIYPPFIPRGTTNSIAIVMPSISYVADPPSAASEQLTSTGKITGWTLNAGSLHTARASGEELLSISMHITALDGHAVSVPRIAIKAIKDASGSLLIHSAGVESPAETAIAETAECEQWPLLCKWKHALTGKVTGLKSSLAKGCHRRPHFMRPQRNHHHHYDASAGQHNAAGRPHHMIDGAPHRHHRSHRLHRFLHTITRFVFAMLVPVAVGVMAGMLTYLVGMLVGCSVAFLWLRLVRGGRRGNASVALGETDGEAYGEADEKVGLMVAAEEEEALPVYVEAPAYVEEETKE